jgi:hypothetical protein
MQNARTASLELQIARQAAVGHYRPQSANGQLSGKTADAVKQRAHFPKVPNPTSKVKNADHFCI